MATLLSRPLLYTCTAAGVGLCLLHPSSPFQLRLPQLQAIQIQPIQCQYIGVSYNPHASPETGWAFPVDRDPLAQKQGRTTATANRTERERSRGFLTASTMRQISLGSVLGLAVGLGLRVFSKALVFVLGVGVVIVEYAASKGYYLFPLRRLQKYVKSVDLHRALTENMAFKTSFGTTMAMAAFAQF
ncbi:hypothetical protein VTN77DRAFT_2909 [Rasamsonia byssochlamydoides]|uniref:uncharacterized protein n=1 Tax=Rasamsonia byssochlamydoides TaxID=89139 RepID=UPI003743DAE3